MTKSKTHNFTDEELDQLTEEERAGIEEDDDTSEGGEEGFTTEQQRQQQSDDDDEKAERDAAESDDDDDEGGGESGNDEADDGGDDKDKGEDDGEEGEPEPVKFDRKPKPIIEAEDIADYDDQIKAIKDKKIELATKFDDGELSAKELYEQTGELDDRLSDLRERKLTASIAEKSQQQAEKNTWEESCINFLEQHSDITQSKLRFSSFDQAVRMVTGDEANKGLSHQQLLTKAYEQWTEELGIEPKSKPEKKEPKPDKKLPPNLGKVPASSIDDADDGKFAHLDRLKGVAYEEALAKLSPTEREAYLQS